MTSEDSRDDPRQQGSRGADPKAPWPQIPSEVLESWSIAPTEYLDRRHNEHWFVESRGMGLVFRGYPEKPFADIVYELDVLGRLLASGWPVPAVVEEPIVAGGRTWCLFTRLPGVARRSATTLEQRRARGRLLRAASRHHGAAG
jgi:aminoglycoside phosphotransferase